MPDPNVPAEARNCDRCTLPDQVKDKEQEYIQQRRQAAGVADDQKLVGLSLSGGGIRSATFCLGVLQRLASRRVLPLVDYMCTVSGGGYIGSCLSSLMTNTDDEPEQEQSPGEESPPWQKQSFDMGDNMPLNAAHQVHHLRKHGDFLILRKGLFRRDVLRAVGSLLLGILSTVFMFLTVILAFSGLLLLYGEALGKVAGGGTASQSLWRLIRDETWGGWMWAVNAVSPTWDSAVCMVAAGALIGAALVVASRFRPRRWSPRGGETSRDTSEIKWLTVFACVQVLLLVVAVAVYVKAFPGGCCQYLTEERVWKIGIEEQEKMRGALLSAGDELEVTLRDSQDGTTLKANVPAEVTIEAEDPPAPIHCPYLLLPALVGLGTWVATGLAYIVIVWTPRWNPRTRSVVSAMHGISLYMTLGSTAVVLLILLIAWLQDYGTTTLIIEALALILTRMFVKQVGEPQEKDSWGQKFKAMSPGVILWLAVPTLIITSIVLCTNCVLSWALDGQIWYPFAVGAVLFGVAGVAVYFNCISPHYFYRDRLSEAYLQTEAHRTQGLALVRDDYSLRLADLHNREGGNPSPYHLIQCSLNLPGTRDLARKDRKSDHFIFSRDYCGSRTTGYAPTGQYTSGGFKVCNAMTISGAALSSLSGFHTSFARAFAMTLFNVRLGYWVFNPRNYGDATVASDRSAVGQGRAGRAERKVQFWPFYLWQELTASASARHALVHVSDGGHTGDNVGLYPLLQRRCRLIIACDAECDPDYTFSSLMQAIRQIYTDENVGVDIDIARIRPADPDKPANAHFMVGRVVYANREDVAWILYLKSSFTNDDEPATVKSYAAQHSSFPHQTTADQFFDDEQFEAYRALGARIAINTLKELTGKEEPIDLTVEDLIAYCEAYYDGRKPEDVIRPSEKDVSRDTARRQPAKPTDERQALISALRDSEWKVSQAAKLLGVAESTVRRRIKKYKVKPPRRK